MGQPLLTVDGMPVPIEDTVRLLQSEPYPGGHRYELMIAIPDRFAKDLISLPVGPLSRAEQQMVFFAIEGTLAGSPLEGSPPARFVLNTADSAEWVHGNLVIVGTCSQLITDKELYA